MREAFPCSGVSRRRKARDRYPQPAADLREGRGGAALASAAALGVEVITFLEEPAPRPLTSRSRPRRGQGGGRGRGCEPAVILLALGRWVESHRADGKPPLACAGRAGRGEFRHLFRSPKRKRVRGGRKGSQGARGGSATGIDGSGSVID